MQENQEVKELVNTIYKAIDDKKGNNITIIKFTPEISSICDFFIIADAESDRQIKAIMDNIIMKVKEKFRIKPFHIDGEDSTQWLVLDYIDVIVHLFLPETREFYALEDLWADAQFYYTPLK